MPESQPDQHYAAPSVTSYPARYFNNLIASLTSILPSPVTSAAFLFIVSLYPARYFFIATASALSILPLPLISPLYSLQQELILF